MEDNIQENENLASLPFKVKVNDNILEIISKDKDNSVKRNKVSLYLFNEEDALELSMYQVNKYRTELEQEGGVAYAPALIK
jgi:hypothetical protein